MTNSRHICEGSAGGCTNGAARAARRKGLGRRLLTRVLPGSVAVVAAFALPEFSVGAGDLARNDGLTDPPEPPSAKGLAAAKPGLAGAKPGLAGVRYAAMVELAGSPPQGTALTLAETLALTPAGARARPDTPTDTSAALVPPPLTPLPPGRLPEASSGAALPIEPAANVAAVPLPKKPSGAMVAAASSGEGVLRAPEDGSAAPRASSLPLVEAVEAAQAMSAPIAAMAVAAPAAAPRPAPPGSGRVPVTSVAGPAVQPAPAAVPIAAAAAVPVSVAAPAPPRPAPPAGSGAIEQLTPARIAAAQAAPGPGPAARPASAPDRKPVAAAAAPVAPRAAKGAPGTAPASRPAPKPAAAAPVPATRPAPAPGPALRPAPAAPPVAAAAAVLAPKPKPALAAPPSAASSPVPLAVTARLVTRVDGKTAGAVDFQQTAAGLKVRLGSIAEVLSDRFDAGQLARIRGSAAGNTYLSLAELQAQGIPISYDPVYDEFNVGLTDTRPKAARKVHMDQISTPERGIGATGMDQVRR